MFNYRQRVVNVVNHFNICAHYYRHNLTRFSREAFCLNGAFASWRLSSFWKEEMNNTTATYRTIQECSFGVSEALTVVLSMVSLLALTGNFLVILTFIKTVSLKTSSNYYIVNMAASDLVCVLLNWPLYATEGMLKTRRKLNYRHYSRCIFLQTGDLFTISFVCGVHSELSAYRCGQIHCNCISTESLAQVWKDSDDFSTSKLVLSRARIYPVRCLFSNHWNRKTIVL